MKYKKYIKRFFIGLLSSILLIVIAIFILITFYKKELASTLVTSLKENYGLVLKIEKIQVSLFSNWPKASLQLKNTSLASELYPDKPILTAGSVALSLDIVQLLKKKFIIESVIIKDAKVSLIKNLDGSKNFSLKPDTTVKTPSKNIKFEISKITIKNTLFSFTNFEKGQKMAIHFKHNTIQLKNQLDGVEAKFLGDIKVGGLLFKPEKGAFLKNTEAKLNLHLSVFTKSKSIFVHLPSSVIIEKQTYLVSSFIDLSDKKQFVFTIEGKNINYQKSVGVLNYNLQKNLSGINLNRPIDAKIMLIAKLGVKQDPIIIAHVNGQNNDVTIGSSKIPYSHLFFKCVILSLDSSKQKGNSETAKICFKTIKGNLYDFPFTASLTISNFDKPNIDLKAKLAIDAKKIKFKLENDFILKGSCIAKLTYSGPTDKLNKKQFLDAPMKLNANMLFNNLSYQERNKPYIYAVSGNAYLTNKDLKFENLMLNTDAGKVNLKGYVSGFTNYALGYNNGFKATLTAKTENFDLNPYLTTQTKKADSKGYKKTIQEEQSNFEFNVALAAKKLMIRKVVATDATINLLYKNKLLDVKAVNMTTCKGKLHAKGTVYDLNKIAADVKIEDVDVKELFNEFENFGQKAIESKHLQGTIFIDTQFKTDLDDNMEVIGNSINGEIKLKLKEGHLLNFEPLQNISDYIFRNRDFNDISFTEINQTCKVKGFEMNIQEMEIASNVLNLFVSGTYNFKDNSNINILVPWSNLKRRGKNYIPKSSGQTSENTKGLKLNYSGLPKKMKLSLGYK